MGKGRAPCCDKSKVKKGPWSPQEDLRLTTFIQQHGHTNWRSLPKEAGLLRCGKSCRLRWINYLRPDLKRGNFTKEEEETIIKLHRDLGNKWSQIASCLPGRTDNEIKNVWHTHLKKRSEKEDGYYTNHRKDVTKKFSSSSTSSLSSSSSSISILSTRRNQSIEDIGAEEKKQENDLTKGNSTMSNSSNDASNENSSTSNSSREIKQCSNFTFVDGDIMQTKDTNFLLNDAYQENYEMLDIQNFPLEIDSGFWEMLDKEDPIYTCESQANEFEICQSTFEEGKETETEKEKEKECLIWMKNLEKELLVETNSERDQNLSEDICRQLLSSPRY